MDSPGPADRREGGSILDGIVKILVVTAILLAVILAMVFIWPHKKDEGEGQEAAAPARGKK